MTKRFNALSRRLSAVAIAAALAHLPAMRQPRRRAGAPGYVTNAGGELVAQRLRPVLRRPAPGRLPAREEPCDRRTRAPPPPWCPR